MKKGGLSCSITGGSGFAEGGLGLKGGVGQPAGGFSSTPFGENEPSSRGDAEGVEKNSVQ